MGTQELAAFPSPSNMKETSSWMPDPVHLVVTNQSQPSVLQMRDFIVVILKGGQYV